ncbi:MAG: hypothetical protein US57_C0014G0027 [Candidatus Moranbacteria bacterium GW2011_GWC2_37_73]|nr:MAG: hypothetical protein UR95_C0002G0047 [Parcubacteria group bacterium GW2011_GWC1_36_108]KKP99908.1 MAG: hypothetical protein US09_C0029G0011 [Candidatus Moranbacteria bacterium GW2011_GWD1_36_198]KKQ01348.1 MAG: hypothetical protein US10_C0016G0018 [Candidatus Moranbacteria bacterium GW2011_GWD2_36_198]KKQ39404.1 MAG: hypothetical protein US57_C0014G0027 [Candidatus Moranbacteria bacterium GW2011_GWC2_37_73]
MAQITLKCECGNETFKVVMLGVVYAGKRSTIQDLYDRQKKVYVPICIKCGKEHSS